MSVTGPPAVPRRFASQRKTDCKRRSRSNPACHADRSALAFDSVFDDRKSEACSAGFASPGFVHAIKTFENPRKFVAGNSIPGIRDRKVQHAVLRPGGNMNLAAVPVVLDGVVD